MKRSALRRRTPLRRGSRPLGQAARERVRTGGKIAVGRPSLNLEAYRALVAQVMERANHRCERCGRKAVLDPHHVRSRARGGPDEADNLVALCRWVCHRLVDQPYRRGRLLVSPLGGGRFCFKLVQAPNKWLPGVTLEHHHTPTLSWAKATGNTAQLRLRGCIAR